MTVDNFIKRGKYFTELLHWVLVWLHWPALGYKPTAKPGLAKGIDLSCVI